MININLYPKIWGGKMEDEAPDLPSPIEGIKTIFKGIGRGLTNRYVLPVVTALGAGLLTYALTPNEIKQGNFEVEGYEMFKFSDRNGEYIFTEEDGKVIARKLPKTNAFTLPEKKFDSAGNLEEAVEEIFVHGESYELKPITRTAIRIKKK